MTQIAVLICEITYSTQFFPNTTTIFVLFRKFINKCKFFYSHYIIVIIYKNCTKYAKLIFPWK